MYAESRTCPGVAGASRGGASSGPIRAVAAVGSRPLPGAVAVATGASGTERELGHAEGAACPAAASSRVHSRAPAFHGDTVPHGGRMRPRRPCESNAHPAGPAGLAARLAPAGGGGGSVLLLSGRCEAAARGRGPRSGVFGSSKGSSKSPRTACLRSGRLAKGLAGRGAGSWREAEVTGRTSGLGRCRGERTGHLDARASWRPNTRRVHTCTYAPTCAHTYARTHVRTCMQHTRTRTPSLSDQAGVSPAVCHGFFSFPSLSEWGCPRGSRPQALAPVCPPPRSPHLPAQNSRPVLRPRRASRHQLPAGGELSHHTARLWCWPLPWPGLTLHPSVPVTVGFWVPQRAWEPWFRLHPARPRGGQLLRCS